jgi:hypothetical protein
VAATGARLLVADCAHPAPLAGELRPLLAEVRRFGCARVLVLRPSHGVLLVPKGRDLGDDP